MRQAIFFMDAEGRQTSDFIDGFPLIPIDIDLSYKPGATRAVFSRVMAIIDTGTNNTMISNRIAEGHTEVRQVQAINMVGAGLSRVFTPLIRISGMLEPEPFDVATIQLPEMADVLIGRDILSRFKLVMDTPGRQFYIERP